MNHHVNGDLQNDFDYDSDKIDSDIEEMLYASVHHQTIGSPELSFKCSNVDPNAGPNDKEKFSNHLNWSTPTVCKIQNHRRIIKKQNSAEKRQKQKHPLKDDLTICNMEKSAVNKNYSRITQQESTTFNISYGNNILLNGSDISEKQNQFYSEDSCDSVEDIRKKLPSDKRYWKILKKDHPTRKAKIKQCHHCFSVSHLDRDCPKKIRSCFICGDNDHRQKSCDKKRICSICFRTGHLSKFCLEKIRCKLCHIIGHSDDECTFHWRKYLTKTREEDLDDLKITKNSDSANRSRLLMDQVSINDRISCYNCGMNGSHFAHECKSITINRKRFEIPSPIFNLKPQNKNINRQSKLASSSYENTPNSSDDSLTYVMDILQRATANNGEQSKLIANGKPDKCKKRKKNRKKVNKSDFKRTVKPTEMTKPRGKKSTKLKRIFGK